MVVRHLMVAAAAIVLCAVQSVCAQENAPAGSAKTGQDLYVRHGCFECHGLAAQGANFSGPRIAPPVIPYEAFVKQLRQPRNDMPPYSEKVLNDRQVADIYAFLRTIPKPPDVKTIPLLQ